MKREQRAKVFDAAQEAGVRVDEAVAQLKDHIFVPGAAADQGAKVGR